MSACQRLGKYVTWSRDDDDDHFLCSSGIKTKSWKFPKDWPSFCNDQLVNLGTWCFCTIRQHTSYCQSLWGWVEFLISMPTSSSMLRIAKQWSSVIKLIATSEALYLPRSQGDHDTRSKEKKLLALKQQVEKTQFKSKSCQYCLRGSYHKFLSFRL